MGSPKKFIFLTFLCLFILPSLSYSQIVFRELPGYKANLSDSMFFDISQTRNIILLDGDWSVSSAGEKPGKKISVGVPSIFQGEGDLIFEKTFSLSPALIKNHNLKIVFLGLNYTADISVNNVIIFRHPGGEYPFDVNLPRDILNSGKENVLTVRLHFNLDSENTIPVKQRFLFPANYGGIFRDVYIKVMPNVFISNSKVKTNYDANVNKATVNINVKIENKEFKTAADSLFGQTDFTFKINLISPNGTSSNLSDEKFQLPFNKEKVLQNSVVISSPQLWSTTDPNRYKLSLEIWRGDELVDIKNNYLSIYSFKIGKNNLYLNNDSLQLQGITLIQSDPVYGPLESYSQMENDIKLVKETGFNCIRFEKSVPHPYLIYLCGKYGILAFMEMPLNSIPGNLTQSANFITRSENYLSNYLNAYKNYQALAAFGIGGSYLSSLPSHAAFLSLLASIIKKESNLKTYASFADFDVSKIDGLDMYGVELFTTPINEAKDKIKALQNDLGKAKIFISEDTYVVNIGNSNGYVNDYSYEAQAKYYSDLINYSQQNSLSGFFINSMFDYCGDYASLIAGYNKTNLYTIGLVGQKGETNRISYNVVKSKLLNQEKVTIPIGSKKNDSPMSFILFGLVLALIVGVLVNSGRKFREDSSRALLRPYNFFADVRDQRIISGYHSTLLGIVIAAVSGLVIVNLLYYLRLNVLFEKILIDFGSRGILKFVSYLSWNPLASIFWITLASVLFLLCLIIIIKAGSFFVRNRVYFSSVYFTVIWAFLPVVLLIPIGIILYRVLNADVVNLIIYASLFVFVLLLLYRLLKGIYVIYDVNAGSIYFYSFLFIVFVFGGILFYFQVSNLFFDYLRLTLTQYKIF